MNNRHSQRGLTLIELMVSLAISLFIVLAIVTLFSRTSALSRNQEQNADMTENARFATQEIARMVRQAAFNNSGSGWSAASASISVSNSSTFSDRLVIRLQPAAAGGGGTMQDCTGETLDNTTTLVTNTFYVALNGNTRQLMCDSQRDNNAVSTVVLADNIEAFRVMQGFAIGAANMVSNDVSNCTISQYLRAGLSTNTPLIAIRLGLVVRSPQEVATADRNNPTTFNLLGNDVASAVSLGTADLSYPSASGGVASYQNTFKRRIFGTTIYVRNQCSK